MEKKYVIVGANTDKTREYPDIEGAKNSALRWQSFLDKNDFKGKLFTDDGVNRNLILTEMENLFKDLKKDDFAVFIFVGHGTQYKNNEEEDGLDEVLKVNGKSITDDEIREKMSLNTNAPVLIIIDACYNGVLVSNKTFADKNEIAFSSSTNNQEMQLDYFDGKVEAVFSHFMLDELEKSINVNYNDLFVSVSKTIKENKYKQITQLIHTNDLILFSPIFQPLITLAEFDKIDASVIICAKETPNIGQGGLQNVSQNFKFLNKKILQIEKDLSQLKSNSFIN